MTEEEKIAQMWVAEAAAKKAAPTKKSEKKKRKFTEHGVGSGQMVAGSPGGGQTSSAIAPPPKVKASQSRLPGMKRVERTVAMSSQFDGFGVATARPKTNLDSIVSRRAKKAMAGSQKPFPDKQENEAVCKGCNQIYPKAAMKRTQSGHACPDCA